MKIFIIHEVSYLDKPVYEYQDFAERLAARGHDVTVIDFSEHRKSKLCVRYVSKTGLKKIRLINLPNIGIPLFKYLSAKISFPFRLQSLIKQYQPDVILLYSVFINGVGAVKVANRNKIPVVFRALDAYHLLRKNTLESRLLKLSEKYIYRHVNALSVTNAKMRDYVQHLSGGNNLPAIDVLDHGVDTDHFQTVNVNKALAAKLGVFEGDFVCVFLGTTYEFTRLDKIVGMIPAILKKLPSFKLLIIGAGELDNKISDEAIRLGLIDRVIQVGMIEYGDLPKYLALAKIAINPFELNSITRDIVPIKILQYLASELPVVSTPLPDLVLKIPACSGAIWFSANDSLAQFVDCLIDVASAQNLDKAGQLGRKYMELHYSMNAAIQKLEDALVQPWNTY